MYTISDLERISGVRAHTIRIWEKRYDLFSPDRTKGNHRLYGDADVLYLLNINRMVSAGHRISKVAKWSPEDMKSRLDKMEGNLDSTTQEQIFYTDEMLSAAMSYNEARFESAFMAVADKYSFEHIWMNFLVPVLHKVGNLWLTKKINPAQEHFISSLIRRKIEISISNLKTPVSKNHDFLLFLPSGEYHELGLLMCYYVIKNAGFHVVYLGENVPIENLRKYVAEYGPKTILTYVQGLKLSKHFMGLIHELRDVPVDVLLAGTVNGYDLKELQSLDSVLNIGSIEGLLSYLSNCKN